MGYDLHGAGGAFHLNSTYWAKALEMAHKYGWKPEGTRPPELNITNPEGGPILDWDGGYFWNEGQEVTDTDAKGIADALEKAMPDIPDRDVLEHKRSPTGGIPVDTPVNLFEWYSGEKDYLREFIEFSRAGEFQIW